MGINDIFDDDQKPSKYLIWIIISITAILLLCIFHTMNYDFSKFKMLFDHNSTKNYVNILIGFLSSILSTILFEYYIKKKNEQKKISFLKNIADQELLRENLSMIEGFGKRFLKNYNIKCKILNHRHPEFFTISVDYVFEKTITSPNIRFQFSRIIDEKDREKIKLLYENAAFGDYEFFDAIDETDLSYSEIISEKDYTISNPLISFGSEQGFATPLSRIVDQNNIIYSANIPADKYRSNQLAKFKFNVKFPLEINSFHDFTIDLPLDKIDCTLDYSEVKEKIFISGTYFISSKQGPTVVESSDDSQFNFFCNNWLMPKSSLVFIWWKKNKNDK